MTKTKKLYAVFYDSDIMRCVSDGRFAIFTHKKYAEAYIWNGNTVFELAKQNKLKPVGRTNTEIADLNRKYSKHHSVKLITYEVKE